MPIRQTVKYNVGVNSSGPRARLPDMKSQTLHLEAVPSWASYLTVLCLNVLICKIRIKSVPLAYRVFAIIELINLCEKAQSTAWHIVKPHVTLIIISYYILF